MVASYNTPIRRMSPVIEERLRLVFPKKLFQIDRAPAIMTVKEYERITRQSPFIGLAFLSIQVGAASGREMLCQYHWRLICVLKATGRLDRRFKGDARDMGMDDIMDVAIACLHGHSFNELGACEVTSADSVFLESKAAEFADEDTIMAHINFVISSTLSAADLRLTDPEDFKGLNVSWLVNGEKGSENAEKA
ncbi:hypothetical protein [Candidatus Tokpelaia sp.]|uniref:hypothetical protein n=1 Tax=Candidatus Tokpelaia sp. TaxID=2233777 RepID=UPI00123B8D87|nr:hypothetical protein [Candidatus Tokpelaia sp.]KAA6405786.1 hypothetical protein DPQ22_02885 [Candidatus Tokpelaia sp.]